MRGIYRSSKTEARPKVLDALTGCWDSTGKGQERISALHTPEAF